MSERLNLSFVCIVLITHIYLFSEQGARGFGNVIPPSSVLVFDVELVDVTKKTTKEEL